MTPNPSLQWNEILAAYADGEFEGRDDLALLARVRDSYLRQARNQGWVRLDADRDRTVVAADVYAAVAQSLEVDAN